VFKTIHEQARKDFEGLSFVWGGLKKKNALIGRFMQE
jgi:hypothetical protein